MKELVFIVIFYLNSSGASGQPASVVRVKNGKDATKYVAAKDRFLYKDFQTGRIQYKNGNFANAKVNYCYLFGEIMFVDPKGDTLLIADNNLVSYVQIEERIFLFAAGTGYLEVVDDHKNIKLARQIKYVRGGFERHGAYENRNELGAVSNAANFTDINGMVSKLPPNNTILLKPVSHYFFIDGNGRSHKASRDAILRIFSKSKKPINAFLISEKLNFSKEADLRSIVSFCAALPQE